MAAHAATFRASRCFPFASQRVAWMTGKQIGSPEGKANCLWALGSTGAGEEIRTLDPNLGNVGDQHFRAFQDVPKISFVRCFA